MRKTKSQKNLQASNHPHSFYKDIKLLKIQQAMPPKHYQSFISNANLHSTGNNYSSKRLGKNIVKIDRNPWNIARNSEQIAILLNRLNDSPEVLYRGFERKKMVSGQFQAKERNEGCHDTVLGRYGTQLCLTKNLDIKSRTDRTVLKDDTNHNINNNKTQQNKSKFKFTLLNSNVNDQNGKCGQIPINTSKLYNLSYGLKNNEKSIKNEISDCKQSVNNEILRQNTSKNLWNLSRIGTKILQPTSQQQSSRSHSLKPKPQKRASLNLNLRTPTNQQKILSKIKQQKVKYMQQYRKMLLGMKAISLDTDLPRIKYVEQNQRTDKINFMHLENRL